MAGYPENRASWAVPRFPYSCGAWEGYAVWQFASAGGVDRNVSGLTRAQWLALAKPRAAKASAAKKASTPKSAAKAVKRGEVAAAVHRDMCEDDDNGYSWSPRWGEDGKGPKSVSVGGSTYSYDRGSYDCSSSVIAAWRAALKGTRWEHALDSATYTGNIADVFVASGLFEVKPMSFLAQPGDLYLNEASHVAMCQTQEPDVLSEFSINENGVAYGGRVGDQTGREAYVHAYYDYPFDFIVHYNGKADAAATAAASAPTKASTAQNTSASSKALAFRVSTDAAGRKWLAAGKQGTKGTPVRWLAVKGAKRYRVHTERSGWLPYVTGYDVKDLDKGCAGDGSPVNAVEIDDATVRYRARRLGGAWFDHMRGRVDEGGSSDHFAGDMANRIDGFEASRA